MGETWKECVGFNGYFVSTLGRMKSSAKIDKKGRYRKERMLILTTNADGYKKTSIQKNGKNLARYVHRLVYEAFIQPIPEGYEINHLNGVRDDNRPQNLDAVTHAENVKYSKDVLNANYATYGNARMTDEQRTKILALKDQGLTHRKIGSIVGFSKSQISNVVSGKCWNIKSYIN